MKKPLLDRDMMAYLAKWKDREIHKPLIFRGARQVGTSFLVQQFAQQTFSSHLVLDFEQRPDLASLFASKDPPAILELLQAKTGTRLVPGGSCLFLDEVQAAPQVLSALRYFQEQLPALHVIAAGSLLEFAMAEPAFSVPVGRVEYLHLGPITFEESLVALGKDHLREFLRAFRIGDEMPEALHKDLMRAVRTFCVVGGMPESLRSLAATGSPMEGDALRQSILFAYREDFHKYGTKASVGRIDKVFSRAPQLVGRKFQYSQVDREERARDLGQAFRLLHMARVLFPVRHSSANGIPLGAEADERSFKAIFLDVGLLCRACGLGLADLEPDRDLFLVNQGALCEQFVGQHLLYGREPYDEPELFCWMREKVNSAAELDYVISIGDTIVPVEVKAGKTGTLKSLHVFLQEKRRAFGLRFNGEPPSLLDAHAALPDGGSTPFRLLSLPFYLVGQTRRLCRECL